jgi:hypothetical protein
MRQKSGFCLGITANCVEAFCIVEQSLANVTLCSPVEEDQIFRPLLISICLVQ